MDHVAPPQIAQALIDTGARKVAMPGRQLFIRGIIAGGILAYATVVAFTAAMQTATPLVGALVFPVGFVILVLLGCDLVTGCFALAPLARVAGVATLPRVLANIGWVMAGNLVGSVLFGALLTLTMPHSGGLADKLVAVADAKTVAYAAAGAAGWLSCFVKAIFCNWMVTLGVVMFMSSASTVGKIVAMWLPIFMFFSLGFEHLVVNMFVLPTGIMLGAKAGLGEALLWNALPVLLGNFVGGFLFTGMALYLAWGKIGPAPATAAASIVPAARPVPTMGAAVPAAPAE